MMTGEMTQTREQFETLISPDMLRTLKQKTMKVLGEVDKIVKSASEKPNLKDKLKGWAESGIPGQILLRIQGKTTNLWSDKENNDFIAVTVTDYGVDEHGQERALNPQVILTPLIRDIERKRCLLRGAGSQAISPSIDRPTDYLLALPLSSATKRGNTSTDLFEIRLTQKRGFEPEVSSLAVFEMPNPFDINPLSAFSVKQTDTFSKEYAKLRSTENRLLLGTDRDGAEWHRENETKFREESRALASLLRIDNDQVITNPLYQSEKERFPGIDTNRFLAHEKIQQEVPLPFKSVTKRKIEMHMIRVPGNFADWQKLPIDQQKFLAQNHWKVGKPVELPA